MFITLTKLCFYFIVLRIKRFNNFFYFLEKFICVFLTLYLSLFIWLGFWGLQVILSFSEEFYFNSVFTLNCILLFPSEIISFFIDNFSQVTNRITGLVFYYKVLNFVVLLLYNIISQISSLLIFLKIYLFYNESFNLLIFFLLDYFSFFLLTLFYFFKLIFGFFYIIDFFFLFKIIFLPKNVTYFLCFLKIYFLYGMVD